ncbi:hypothetical protein IKF84_01950, partial [Candidatus Saccharibacteria bacterium]|nr:hypothetical protein [Candidatus Saccharibacteria bacterium]
LICPKGWILPSDEQTRSIGPNDGSAVYVFRFSPLLGGYYGNHILYNEAKHGYWWDSTIYNGARRYYLNYYDSNLYTKNDGSRFDGLSIRCIQAS